MKSRLIVRLVRLALLLSLIFGAASGCGSIALDNDAGQQNKPSAYEDPQILEAESLLRQHRIRDAHNRYDEIISFGEPSARGTAIVGRSLTGLMLLPEGQHVQRLLVEHLGATRADYSAEALLWDDEGILYWLARGTSWEDNGQLQGIRSLMADKLPWSSSRLKSPDAFLDGLDSTGSQLAASLVEIASSVGLYEEELGRALIDPSFERFYIPAEVFHDQDMGIVLGRAEIALLRGALALARGALLFIAAYEHDWQLSHLSESYWQDVMADPEHPEHRAELESAEDYLFTYLDTRLLRSFRDASLLAESRRAFQLGLLGLTTALELGREREAQGSSLQWHSGSREVSDQLTTLLRAFSSSLQEPARLPYTQPAATLNLSLLFGDGRLVPPSTPLFERAEESYDDGMGGQITDVSWSLSGAAIDSLTHGILTPDDEELSLSLDPEALSQFQRDVSGELEENVSDAYLGSR